MRTKNIKPILAMLLVVAMVISSVGTSWKVEAATEYTITYNGNGGTTSDGRTTQTVTAAAGKTTKTIKAGFFKRSGYTQTGWSTQSSASKQNSSNTIGLDVSVTHSKNITYYAVWKANSSSTPTTYTITFHGNGGTTSDGRSTQTANVASGKTTTTPKADFFKRKGYTQTGWSTESSASKQNSSNTVGLAARITATKNITYYAVWKKDTYTIVYHWLDGYNNKDRTEKQTAYIGQNVTLKKPATSMKDGSIIIGWGLSGAKKEDRQIAPTYTLGFTTSALTTVKGKEIHLYPVCRYSIDVIYSAYAVKDGKYSQAFIDSYQHRNQASDQKTFIAPAASQIPYKSSLECIGFATRRDAAADTFPSSTGKFVEAGTSVQLSTLVGIDWLEREKIAANKPAKYLKENYYYDSVGYIIGSKDNLRPDNVMINLYPIWREKGSDDIASDHGAVYEGKETYDRTAGGFHHSYQTIELFLTQDQMEELYTRFLRDWDDTQNYPREGSLWKTIGGEFFSGTGFLQALLGVIAQDSASKAMQLFISPELGLTVTVFSILFDMVASEDPDALTEFVNTLKKKGLFGEGKMKGVHIAIKIDTKLESGTRSICFETVDKYDNILLQHKKDNKGGTWSTKDVEKQFSNYFK